LKKGKPRQYNKLTSQILLRTVRKGKTMVSETKQKKIMVQPLPMILDEIDDSITAANAAAKDARKAAEEARRAGEKAANEAARVAAEAISKVQKTAEDALALAKLLNSAVIEMAQGLEKKLTTKK
jgi:F0F1-type ATP synthase membrane subunit b/b'